MIKVLIVDDQTIVRAGFAALLNAQPDITVVGEAGDGREAVRLAERAHPDVVVMDIRMPGMDGIEATRRILGRPGHDGLRVLVLTTFDVDEYVYDALSVGASGFLLKDATAEELVSAVRVVARGDSLLAPQVTGRLIREFTRQRRNRPQAPAELSTLTAREREVLILIAGGLSNGEIAEHLVLSEHTVKTHVARVFTKLSLRDRAQAVMLAYESGLVTPGGDRED
ncbi:DNA-binding response regulator, NarL/FixJ family, contains REC and HTH domains [Thermomonospora echinospora]|uniref:DNA-binding response regulator, NarL/FixJ family, contains REC and HTH domains n=1 Tax=Thermomonospora echinospora TaxID=1992 RepID=A0A1H5WBF5_9ACTN|nr:response regulator transcription factor [Thermomonospora echinospora]SEF96909.1 DNA-binding response regulator, NarL/FixJ family, contains REC and HTH domains [Thermomonospora echinospora]